MTTEEYNKISNQTVLNEIRKNGEQAEEFLTSKYKDEAKLKRLDLKSKAWYNQAGIGHVITIIALIFGFYQWLHKSQLESDFEILTKERNSLKLELVSYKSTLFDLKLKLENQKSLKK